MKKILFSFFVLISIATSAQVGIGVSTANSNPSAQLDVTSTTKGFMPPRMTYAQRNAIATPVAGLIVYCTDCATNGELHYYNGTNWVSMAMGIAATLSIPSISTTAATLITPSTATSGGSVSTDGGRAITARGVCWSTTANPTIADSKTTDAGTTGAFTSSINGLTHQTIYYVRAYATNSIGTGYGTAISFTTSAVIPTLSATTAATSITATTATSGGTVSSDGGSAITARGVCWSTTANPTIADSKTTDAATATFTSSLTSLSAGTTYYVRAYATNSIGTGYGTAISFTTSAVIPTLSATTAATSITATTATSGGTVSSDGGSTITARGVCWSTTANPTIADSKTTDAGTTGTFTGSITGLIHQTIYYVRAYATNSIGTGYGTAISFTTSSAVIPTLGATTAATNITGTSATSGGTVSSDGGSAITAKGVCWSTTANPTIANSITTDAGSTGVFTSSIMGLTQQTIYYVRAYATNSMGTAYGSQRIFTTGALSIGNSYLGGVVAYILASGDAGYSTTVPHGLIAATSDQGTGNTWNNGTYTTTGATATSIGSGLANTNTIIANQGNTGTYAAKICRDYTGGGYADWYLPSSGELAILYSNRVAIGGFAAANYWSSTERNDTDVCKRNFSNGTFNCTTAKNQLYYVRAVRSF